MPTTNADVQTAVAGHIDRAAYAAERAAKAYGRPGGVLAAIVSCVLIVTGGVVYAVIMLSKAAPAQGAEAASAESPQAYATRGYVDGRFIQVLSAIERETAVRMAAEAEIKTLLRGIDDKLFQVIRSMGQPTQGGR